METSTISAKDSEIDWSATKSKATRICITLFLISLIASSQTSFSIVGIPLHAKQSGFTTTQLSILLGVFPLFASFSAFVSGPVSDFVGRKRIIIIGLTTLGLALALHVFAVEYYFLVGLRTFTGLSTGMLAGLPSVFLSDNFHVDRQRSLIGKSVSGYALGQTIGIPIGILIMGTLGYLELNFILGILTLSLVPFAFRHLPEQPPSSKNLSRDIKDYFTQAKATIRSHHFATLMLASALSFVATSLFYVSFTLWMYGDANLQPSQLAPMYLGAGLLQLFVLGFLLQKLSKISPKSIIAISFLISALLFATSFQTLQSVTLASILFILTLGAISLRIPSIQHLVNNAGVPRQKGLRMSLIQTCSHLGKALGATAASLLYAHASTALVIVGCGLISAVCSSLFLIPDSTRKILGRAPPKS